MTAINRKDRVRLVWPGDELDGHTGTVRRVIRDRKPDGTYSAKYIVALDEANSYGLTNIHVYEDRVEPLTAAENGGETR